ncbi:MAG TPA: hypothetical protein DGC76_05120, partial [Candidatus Accumulibacter sp.]|nr:hypothetical protein [Accumulibacter sp.]
MRRESATKKPLSGRGRGCSGSGIETVSSFEPQPVTGRRRSPEGVQYARAEGGGSGVYEEESELIEALLAGEPNAPREFVRRYSRLAYAILLREFGFSRHEADDCFQTSLERLVEDDFRRTRLWRREGPFHAYFAQTVRNVARNFVQRRQQVELPGDDCDEEGLQADPPDPAPGPERRAILEQLRAALDECVGRLAQRSREVFRMRHFEEYSYREIAIQAEMTVGHVGTSLSRAER